MDTRETLLFLLGLVFFILLVGLRSLKLTSSDTTMFELERRAAKGDEADKAKLLSEQLLPDLLTFRHVFDVLLSVVVIVCFVWSLGWLIGIVISVVALLEAG